MTTKNVKRLLFGAMIILIFQSCANDDETFETLSESETTDDSLEDTEDENIDPADRVGEMSDETTQLVVDWNNLWLELDRYTEGMRPNATARALAYINLAVYETAIYSMPEYTTNAVRLQSLEINEDRRAGTIDLNLALNRCYARVFEHFMFSVSINENARINNLENRIENTLSDNLTEEVIRNSRDWGNYVASRIINYSQTDNEAEEQILDPQPFFYEPPVGDGFWTYSDDAERAWFPYWGSARTFVISSEETSSVPPPIEYSEDTSSAYYAEMFEVYEISTIAAEETNEDLWISEFWSDDVEGLMMSPPGRQISIAVQLIQQFDLDYQSALVLLLKLGFSLNDASVSTWADKYEYMVMRPNVYIQEFIDAGYQTNLYKFIFWPNPSFPGYPSGHSAFASAAAGIFIDEFGDTVNFTDRSHEGRTEFLSAPREFTSFSEMAEENAFSRVPFGVHIRMDCTEGLRLGYEVSEAVNSLNLTSNL